ncbi:hypothetical protein KPH14_000837 [Odynerus spinipes]|uniref:Uncharacterized protein n=1 Tax=Odynerus spinipes TaxID=1348599 RepID=A0AAD9VL10_9HYME|nr:hypothetical protein KPH14_000837 [Odynerus spinipes]
MSSGSTSTAMDTEVSKLEDSQKRKLVIEKQLASLINELVDLQEQESSSYNTSRCTTPGDENTEPAELFEEKLAVAGSKPDPEKQGAIPKIVKNQPAKKLQAEISEEILGLLSEIRNRPPPRIKTSRVIVTEDDLQRENLLRRRIDSGFHPLQMSTKYQRPARSTDNPTACVAPSVAVKPAPFIRDQTFNEILRELGVPGFTPTESQKKPVYFVDCRIISEQMLKDIITKRAEALVVKMSKENSSRPGFCQICGADGFDKEDCIYPHGVEHERMLGRCPGCSRDLSLYCPECPDCNIRYADLTDWLRLNYATWPSWSIPVDHRVMVEQTDSYLKRKFKVKFDDPSNEANKIRQFLIRENALATAEFLANPAAKTAIQMSEEKRQQAVCTLYTPLAHKTLDEVMKERPELSDEQGVSVVVPSKYKKERRKAQKQPYPTKLSILGIVKITTYQNYLFCVNLT